MDFELLYRQYFKDVYLYLCSLSVPGSLAEELTQETFFKALKALDRFDGSKDIRAWLFTIAKNTYFHHLKKEKKMADQPLEENGVHSSISFTEALADTESAFLIHQFLHTMPEPYKEVFSLRVFGELPYEKIGMLFGKSSGWARVTFYRAKKQISDYM
ncbi:MAG: RNA polymerase sigma factor, partial [Bacillota bacterium]|nr:RNA polymerase sigma factor [Bacillota bacterium]